MKMPCRSVVALALVVAFCISTLAEVATGTPQFGTFGGGPFDAINLSNLNVHFEVPIRARAGRGLAFTYALSYDSSIWNPVTSGGTTSWQPVSNWGWTTKTATVTGTALFNSVLINQQCPSGASSYTQFTWIAYVDDNAVRHPFNLVTNFCQTLSASGFATDGSGYRMAIVWGTGGGWQVTVTLPSGRVINNVPINNAVTAATKKDENGNQITTSNGTTFTDTLGTTVLTVSGNAPSPVVHTYTAPSGANASVTVNYTTFSIKTNFGAPGISEYGPTSIPLVSSIVYPDGTSFQFTYEDTPGFAGKKTGRIASVTLPTGGTITYSYHLYNGYNGIWSDGKTTGFDRITPDGTWKYERLANTDTVTDPVGNETIFKFSSNTFYETQRQIYQGNATTGTLLQTVVICYSYSSTDCPNAAVTAPITARGVKTFFPNGKWSSKWTDYNGNGLPIKFDEYDWDATNPPLTRRTVIAYATLGNNIFDRPSSIKVYDSTLTLKAQTDFAYDQWPITATSGTPQLTAVTGSRGNLTTVSSWVSGTTFLNKTISYFDTGTPNLTTDVNGSQTQFVYGAGSCGNSFVTAINMPLNLSRSFTYNCTGGIQLSATDENGKTTSANFTDAAFWRPSLLVDKAGFNTNVAYGGATVTETNFILSASWINVLTTLDGMGRLKFRQQRQGPSATTFDSVQIEYDSLGRPFRSSMPYVAGQGQTYPVGTPRTTTNYDALSRPTLVTDGGGGTVSFAYNQNTVVITAGPAPSGENTKRKQYEIDSLGRLTSVCEITGGTGSGTCGQTVTQTGYWTKYQYDVLDNLLSVTQNAQSGAPQTRTFTYDALRRMTSEINPESGTTTYVYDSGGGCWGNFNGDLISRTDASGNQSCMAYDTLHRLTQVTYSGPNAAATPTKLFVYDWANLGSFETVNSKGRLARAVTCTGTNPCVWLTDEVFSYSARGELTELYQGTPHSAGYYHLTANYHPHGPLNTLTGLPSLPTITYAGLDGEGRIRTVTAASGSITGLVTATTYNNTDPLTANEPLGALTSVSFGVNGGATDSDTFHYDKNTGRMLQWRFSVNSQLQVGALGWNSNGSLASLNITDAFNSGNAQNCSFVHDDLSRLAGVNCGTGKWNQTFAYDPYGNISKTGSGIGTSFQATYNMATNRISALPGFTPTYDGNGNLLTDSFHTYTWDPEGHPTSIDNVNLTYDALGRMVEQARGANYTQIVYGPGGNKLALMNGQALVKAFVPLPGGATAVYNSSGLQYYRHSDWLGSSRLASKPDRTAHFSGAYAPFGEDYAQTGATDLNFTGQNQDTVTGDYDFMFREYSPAQGRWISPDPLGLEAANLTDPQSWNTYVYVVNSPLDLIDPLGLFHCPPDDPCPPDRPPPPPPDDGNGHGPGRSGGCHIVMGAVVIDLMACPSGDGGRERPFREKVKEFFKKALHKTNCALAAPLIGSAMAASATTGAGVGGSGGAGFLWGASGTASVLVVADQHKNVGLMISAGGNPGSAPIVFGAGAQGGRQVMVSSANSIFDLRGGWVGGSGNVGPLGVNVAVSSGGTTATVTSGPGFLGKVSAFEGGTTWVPESLTFNCSDVF